jgi:PilZ domain
VPEPVETKHDMRRHDRADLSRPAVAVELDRDGAPLAPWTVRTFDLSRSGLGFVSRRMVHVGRHVVIELIGAGKERQTVLFGVVRQCRYEEGKGYMVGLEFKQVAIGTLLRQYLNAWSKRVA